MAAPTPPSAGLVVTDYAVHDVRFPTSLTGDGTDAMNTSCDYSAAYLILYTGPPGTPRTTPPSSTGPLLGAGMTFTIGRGNELVCSAICALVESLVLGQDLESMFSNMGATWTRLVGDPQLRWLGPEKGVIHLATAAAINAIWDLFARSRAKPLWSLLSSMTPAELNACVAYRYITDALTPAEGLAILQASEPHKQARTKEVLEKGYPAYTTSAGWSGYDDEKVARLTRAALAQGFNHFKLKVGASLPDDIRRLSLLRSIVDNPAELPPDWTPVQPETVAGKNAGPTGCVVMVDANQVWDVPQAIEYMTQLAPFKPWFIEEPTAPDDILGHATIRRALSPLQIGVATGEHAHNRMVFKQLLQASSIDVAQIDSCRLAGPNEILAVLLMAKKFGIPVCPHAGGVGLCEYVVHLSLIDYICISGSIERNVLEYVDHLHEHFLYPVQINSNGRYVVPTDPNGGYSIEMFESSVQDYSFPNGSYWKTGKARTPPPRPQ